ncbi:MAG: PSD1 and planctomycete cytochrome C domain-containing protein [Planctomycetota bacterium]|nr:PSD1 and planctomycete cytochrome C domain-containing protein [Planctomycetota bacterium]
MFGFDFQADHRSLTAKASSGEISRTLPADIEKSLILQKPTEMVDHEGGRRLEPGSWEYNLLVRWIESGAKGGVIRERFAQGKANEPNIQRQGASFYSNKVLPILEDHCYECHGFDSRKGNLSLVSRQRLLAGGESGPAVVTGKPERSLLMRAVRHAEPNLEMPPSGKLPKEKLAILEQWIEMGVPWAEKNMAPEESNRVLVSLDPVPREIRFDDSRPNRRLKIIATWQDGRREDVTCLTRFQTNNDSVVKITPDGLATNVGPGDTHLVAFYDNGVAAIPVLKPYFPEKKSDRPNAVVQTFSGAVNPVDRFINTKLNKLGLRPSSICSDEEFLRRVSIDLTGTLPTPAEVKGFLLDPSADKRTAKVNQLLNRTSYAAWWTNKLCDFTGCNPQSISSLLEVATEEGYRKASLWYDWILERLERNQPYDELVSELMLADLDGRNGSMPYFWTRQSLKESKDTAMSVAHAFLGIQLQCAECHKHPFDSWTQGDFVDFARFFETVTDTKRRATSREIMELKLLRSGTVRLQAGDDPRRPIMDWMKKPGNPWLARAFVNRVWASYFHVGLVEPPDQFTPANPPSHPQLLDWLTRGFIENRYDMKWLHRQITTSDAYQRSWRPNETNREDRRNFSRCIPRRIPAEVIYDAMKQVTATTDQQDAVRTNLRRRAIGHLSMRMAGTHAMKVFGKPDRSLNCDCERVNEPTLLQSIFTQNDPLVRMRIADSGWILELEDALERGQSIDHAEMADQAWVRTVGRFPADREKQRAVVHLKEAVSVSDGMADLLWALMNTKEFLLNH